MRPTSAWAHSATSAVAAEPLDLTAPVEEAARVVSHLLEQPAFNTYMLLKRHANLLAIISCENFGICFW